MTTLKILVLEDDEDLRERLAEVLREEDYTVDAVGNGAEAIQLARGCAYDLVITDIRMAGMDGLEALEQVQHSQPDIRSLVITGYSTEADSIRAIRLGVGDYLKKPFRLPQFFEAVERLLARRRQQLQEEAREQSMRQTVRIALEALARTVAMTVPDCPEGLVGVANLAQRLANHLELSAETGEAVQLATLLTGLQLWAPQTQPGLLMATLSAEIRRLVAEVLESAPDEEAEESLAVQVIRACLTRLAPGPLPTRMEHALAEVLGGSSEVRGPALKENSRSMLSLARTLAYAGDHSAAISGFEQVLEAGCSPEEEAAAWLGLARMAQAQGHSPESRQAVLSATSKPHQLAPSVLGQTLLEGGLLLVDQGHPEGRDFLESAGRIFSRLHSSEGEAQVRLALGRCQGASWDSDSALEESLQLLLAPDYRQDLAACAWYLLPWLLQSIATDNGKSRPVLNKALRLMAREYPREFARSVQRGDLSPSARAAAAAALAHNPSSAVARRVLEGLAADPEPEVRAAAVEPSSAPEAPLVRIYSFGNFEVYRGEERVAEKAWRGHNTRFLLARLAAARGTPVSLDVILELFWPDDVERGRRNLSWTTSAIRKTLRPESGAADPEYLIRTDIGLQLSPDVALWSDYAEFCRHQEAARSAPESQALEHLRQALALYRGPYLEGCYMDWALQMREDLERQAQEILRSLLQASKAAGQNLEILQYGHRLLQLDECCQEAYLTLMQSNLALGRPEEAVRLFEACKRRLRCDLGMDPGIDILREHQRALLSLSAG